jgi:VWFA-related protein
MRRCILLIWWCCVAAASTWAAEPGRFVISAASFRDPTLTVYLDVLDQNGEAPGQLSPADLSARLQEQNLKVRDVKSFDASGEGVAYIFLIDISKSIQRSQFETMREAIGDWINALKANDRMTIFAFGVRVRQLIDFTDDKAGLHAALSNVAPTDLQTKLYLALREAINLGQRVEAGLPYRRVIVILSDGKDEGSGFTSDDIRSLVEQGHMPIYAIGSSRLPAKEQAQYLEALNRLAVLSGGLYVKNNVLSATYNEIKQAIRRVFVAQLACQGCRVNNQSQPLDITLKSATAAWAAHLPVNLIWVPPPPMPPWWQNLMSWKIVLSLLVVLSIVFVVIGVVIRIIGKKVPEPVTKIPPPSIQVQQVKSAQPGRGIQLTVVAGAERGRVENVNLSGKTVVGRDKACDVSYADDTEMSAKHYELILAGKNVEVRDLGSTNGTLLNGARLQTQQRLEDGDLIRAGRTEVRITFGAA